MASACLDGRGGGGGGRKDILDWVLRLGLGYTRDHMHHMQSYKLMLVRILPGLAQIDDIPPVTMPQLPRHTAHDNE